MSHLIVMASDVPTGGIAGIGSTVAAEVTTAAGQILTAVTPIIGAIAPAAITIAGLGIVLRVGIGLFRGAVRG